MSGALTPQGRYELPRDQPVLFDGALMTYRGRARDADRRHRFEGNDGIWRDIDDRDVRDFIQQESLKLLSAAEAVEELKAPEDRHPRLNPDLLGPSNGKARVMFERKLAYCLEWKRRGRPFRTAANMLPIIDAVAATARERNDPFPPPSARTVLGWLADWTAYGMDLCGLSPQWVNSGNRNDRLSPRERELLLETVDEKYLIDTKPTVVTVNQHVKAAFARHNEPLPPEERLRTPSIAAVYRMVHRYDSFTHDFARLGRRAAERKHAPVGSGPTTTRHNEVWEIDHTRVDLVVVDDKTGMPIGRPWLTVIIDRHTRMFMYAHLSFLGPCTDAVFACLEGAISPKENLLAASGLTTPWPGEGTPNVLVPDQGKEFKSRGFVYACHQLGIEIQYTPILKPWYKGRVERAIQTLTRKTFHTVEGTTFADIFERNKERIPEKVAVATLGELQALVLRYIVDVYHRTQRPSLSGKSPLEVWDESVKRHGSRLPPEPRKVREALARVYWRIPQREGLQIHGLLFEAPELADIRTRPRHEERQVLVKVRASDLTRVWFVDPRDQQTKEARIKPHLLDRVRGVTLERWLLARALQRENPEKFGGKDGCYLAYAELDEAVRHKSTQSGAKNREDAAKRWAQLNGEKRWEDAPAFTAGSGSKSVADILDEDEGDPEDAELLSPQSVPLAAPDQSDGHAPAASDGVPEASGRGPRTKRGPSRPKRDGISRPATEEPPTSREEDDFDPEAYAREQGLGTDKRRNTGEGGL